MEHSELDDHPSSQLARRIRGYVIYLIILGAIFSLITLRGDYILAPPYAVSAYIVVFQRNTKYASRKSLISAYLLVILTSDVIQLVLGFGLAGMLLNVIVVSAFITFTDLSHPPAIALAIFSYIVSDPIDFTISSLLALAAIVVGSYIIDKYSLLK